jgi:hypothetical protein
VQTGPDFQACNIEHAIWHGTPRRLHHRNGLHEYPHKQGQPSSSPAQASQGTNATKTGDKVPLEGWTLRCEKDRKTPTTKQVARLCCTWRIAERANGGATPSRARIGTIKPTKPSSTTELQTNELHNQLRKIVLRPCPCYTVARHNGQTNPKETNRAALMTEKRTAFEQTSVAF